MDIVIYLGIVSLLIWIGMLFTFLFIQKARRRYIIKKADRQYVEKADEKVLGGAFADIEQYCDKDMIRILKLMNREERRAWMRQNSNTLKKLKNERF